MRWVLDATLTYGIIRCIYTKTRSPITRVKVMGILDRTVNFNLIVGPHVTLVSSRHGLRIETVTCYFFLNEFCIFQRDRADFLFHKVNPNTKHPLPGPLAH